MKSQFSEKITKILSKLPDTPGVYFFKHKSGSVLYIGKATSLRDRVRSYFSQDIAFTRGPKIVKMLEEFDSVDFQQTDSVLEALILEANLIKKYQPMYNTALKDNKSFNFVVITKEKWPRVLLARGHDLTLAADQETDLDYKIAYSFGPFPNAGTLRDALEMIRKIFPYRDSKCVPYEEQIAKLEKKPSPSKPKASRDTERGNHARVGHVRACFNRQIGLCPGVCTGEITAEEYKERIKNIVEFFRGNKKRLITNLEKQMKAFAKEREFEKASEVKRQIFALNHIHDVSLIKQENIEEKGENVFRIEAYDVAHMSGQNVVGVMTVVENGTPNKAEYRKFKISKQQNNDVAGLREILRRRLHHDEWRLPNLIVVDGGAAQMNAAESVLEEFGYDIPLVAVVKNEHHKPKNILGDKQFLVHESGILLANLEAHRYGIAYHKKLRGL